jgi:hypothetical protein
VAVGLRRRNAGSRQHDSRCEDGGDLASHIGSPSHSFAALWGNPTNRMQRIQRVTPKMCGRNTSGIAEIAKGLFSCAK